RRRQAHHVSLPEGVRFEPKNNPRRSPTVPMRVPEAFSGALGRRFEYVRQLGQGGMAEVYLATDRFHQRQIALKVMRAIESPTEEQKRIEHLWVNEMRLAGRLKHPYILEIYEAGHEADRSFLIMQYLAGGTLASHTQPGTLLD